MLWQPTHIELFWRPASALPGDSAAMLEEAASTSVAHA
jgi:hypothetical protein